MFWYKNFALSILLKFWWIGSEKQFGWSICRLAGLLGLYWGIRKPINIDLFISSSNDAVNFPKQGKEPLFLRFLKFILKREKTFFPPKLLENLIGNSFQFLKPSLCSLYDYWFPRYQWSMTKVSFFIQSRISLRQMVVSRFSKKQIEAEITSYLIHMMI